MTRRKSAGRKKRTVKNHAAACRHVLIVKRRGHSEKFDGRKAYASAYFACRSAHLGEQESEVLAEEVLKRLCAKLARKKQASSHEIFRLIAGELKQLHKDAAFMYEHHLDVS